MQRDYTARVEVQSRDELGELAGAFNDMAEKLDFWEHSNWAQVLFEKSRIETIIQQMNDAIIGLNERQQVLFLNPVMERLLGLAAKDVVGKNALEVALHNDSRAARRGLIERTTERLGDRLVQFREEVTVTVEGHVDRRVAHPRLNRLGVGAGRNGERHTCVSEVVESA